MNTTPAPLPGADPGRLFPSQLTLAIAYATRDPRYGTLPALQAALWREDPDDVADAYHQCRDAGALSELDNGAVGGWNGTHGLIAERMRELHRPVLYRRRPNMTLPEMAESAGVDRETLAACLVHHGYLELVPYGGTQNRRLVTDQAFAAGLGHNVDAGRLRIAHVEGRNRAATFPVFYKDEVASFLWTLDLAGIRDRAATIPGKQARLRWVMDHHGYLPNATVATFAGCTSRAVEKARARAEAAESSVASSMTPTAPVNASAG